MLQRNAGPKMTLPFSVRGFLCVLDTKWPIWADKMAFRRKSWFAAACWPGAVIRTLGPRLFKKRFPKNGLPNAISEKNNAKGLKSLVLDVLRASANRRKAANTGRFED